MCKNMASPIFGNRNHLLYELTNGKQNILHTDCVVEPHKIDQQLLI